MNDRDDLYHAWQRYQGQNTVSVKSLGAKGKLIEVLGAR